MILTTPKRRSLTPYIVGALLGYVCCFAMFGRVFVAGACWHFEVAAFGALFFWLFSLPFHAAFQFGISILVTRFWEAGRQHKLLVLNVPVLVLTVSMLALAEYSRRTEPQFAFKHFVADPFPASVQILQFGRSQAIGEPLELGLEFQAQPKDMEVILHNKKCVLADASTNHTELELFKLKHSIGFRTGIKVDPDIFHFCYVIEEDKRWHLLLNSNRSAAYFYYASDPASP